MTGCHRVCSAEDQFREKLCLCEIAVFVLESYKDVPSWELVNLGCHSETMAQLSVFTGWFSSATNSELDVYRM